MAKQYEELVTALCQFVYLDIDPSQPATSPATSAWQAVHYTIPSYSLTLKSYISIGIYQFWLLFRADSGSHLGYGHGFENLAAPLLLPAVLTNPSLLTFLPGSRARLRFWP